MGRGGACRGPSGWSGSAPARSARRGRSGAQRATRELVALVIVALLALAPAGAAQAGRQAQLQRTLDAWTRSQPSTTAVLVWRLGGIAPVPVLAYQPDSARLPASTMKIVTSAGALIALGPDFRFQTRLYAGTNSVRRGNALVGPIYVKGYGDPVLSTPGYARTFFGGRGGNLVNLARPLKEEGVRLVRGPIVTDESFLDDRRIGVLWKDSYVLECPPLTGLAVNQSYLGEQRGGRVDNPPVAAGRRLRAILERLGVRQVGGVRVGRAPVARGRLVATVSSPPLREVVALMNPSSDNFIAETLTKDVGAYAGEGGTTAAGTAHTAAVLSEQGIMSPDDRLVDGSGLSRSNRLSASTLVRLLAAADEDPGWGRALVQSLPNGGEGTLRRRFLSSSLARRVSAKTGYINGVSTIAGLVTSRAGARYAFAFLMNSADIGGARATQDRLVALIGAGVADGAPALIDPLARA